MGLPGRASSVRMLVEKRLLPASVAFLLTPCVSAYFLGETPQQGPLSAPEKPR